MKIENVAKTKKIHFVVMLLCVIGIPALLFFAEINFRKFNKEEEIVKGIELQEEKGVAEIERRKAELSLLSANARIEKIAEEMGMHKAATDEIVRVEIKDEEKK